MNTADIFNYTIGIVGLILAIVGIVLSVRSIKKKVPTYSIKSVNVISDYASQYENLTVAYKDEKIENFTVSKILFYNRGRETITKQDIVTINPLRIVSYEYEILDASILQVNKTSNKFEVDYEDRDVVNVSFDYLDKNQGAIIQVVHNGLSSDNLTMEGDIRGVQKLTEFSSNSFIPASRRLSDRLSPWIKLILGFAAGYLIIFREDLFFSWGLSEPFISLTLPLLAGILGYLLSTVIARVGRTIPIGLEKFDE